MTSKWENFLKNLGEWRGSFTKISPHGELLDSTPSILNLDGFDDNKAVMFRLRRFGDGGYDTPPIQDYQQEYRFLGRQVIFFETGAFSKGSLQLAPFSEFGAEYGFVSHNRRLRLVQLYDQEGNFSSLTLIREFRNGTDALERPHLTLEQLVGDWQGKADTMYADGRESETDTTRLTVRDLGNGYLEQQLSFREQKISSKARIEGNILHFEDGEIPRQILLLPDGSSSNIPLQVKLRKPFFVEAGWLVSNNERQRLIRSYNEKGEWISSTHVIEHKL